MATQPTQAKTFVNEMIREARETDRLPYFFAGMVRQGLEEQAVAGLKAFAHLWFYSYGDETQLPDVWYRLKDLLDDDLFTDTSELDDDEDDEDEEDDGDDA
jgi:hypothetical protein